MSAPRSLSARAIGRRGLVVWALLLALLALGLLAARLLPEPLAGAVPFGIFTLTLADTLSRLLNT